MTDLPKRGHPGPEAQFRPLHDHGVPVRRPPKGELTLPWEKDAPPALTDRTSGEDASGQYLRQVAACRSEAGKTGGSPQLVYIRGDMETHQQESIRKEGTRAVPYEGTTAGTSDLGGAEGGQVVAGGDGGRRHEVDFDR